VLYEASRECGWLRRIIDHIQMSCGRVVNGSPTIIYEDNTACVAQIQMRYIKTNYTKHISPKFIHMNYKRVGRLVSYKLVCNPARGFQLNVQGNIFKEFCVLWKEMST
jgi:hypothetical protein